MLVTWGLVGLGIKNVSEFLYVSHLVGADVIVFFSLVVFSW